MEVEGPKYSTRLEEKLKRLGLQQAHVKQLAALSITLQTLRLVYEEDVPKHTVRSWSASHPFVAVLTSPGMQGHLCFAAPMGHLCCAALDIGRF